MSSSLCFCFYFKGNNDFSEFISVLDRLEVLLQDKFFICYEIDRESLFSNDENLDGIILI